MIKSICLSPSARESIFTPFSDTKYLETPMNPRPFAASLSSLVSQLLLLLLLVFPVSLSPPQDFQQIVFPLLQLFIVTSDTVATLCFSSLSRKRKRAHLRNPDVSDRDQGVGFGLGPSLRVDSTVPRNPESFKQFFGMKISTFEWLCGLLEPLLDCRDPVESPLDLTAEVRLGIGVFRLATGADYPEISGRFCVSEAASRFCVKQLCRVLCTNFRFWVGFPSQAELESVSTQFEILTGLPSCCGIVSCARFLIRNGSSSDAMTENEAQRDSIAAQIVVDSSSRILSIIAGFRGDKTDSRILRSTSLFKDIENCVILNSRPLRINDACVPQYLVGNGEYPLLPFLLVPFVDPEAGSVEDNFNNAYKSMCVSSIKVVSSLRKWGVLSGTIKEEYKVAVACIGACSILHNMLLAREDCSTFCDRLDEGDLKFQHSARVGENLMEKEASGIRQALARRARKYLG